MSVSPSLRFLLASPVFHLLLGCHYTVISANGTAFPSSAGEDPYVTAARESGAHDLDCPAAGLEVGTIVRGRAPNEYTVDGCGHRAVYECGMSDHAWLPNYRLVLVSRFAL